MNKDAGRVTPVILSGGSGTRLWPLSRRKQPKQSLRLMGAETMFAETLARLSDRAQFDSPITIASVNDLHWLERQMSGASDGMLILEPVPRNTAAAIALAALQVEPETLLLVLPSDHVIADRDGFLSAVARARAVAADGWIVTFGMKAEHPETGYGYIKRGAPLAQGVFEVEAFVEKPDHSTAAEYCKSGAYDWNGGIFMFRAGRMIEAFAEHAPDVLAGVTKAVEGLQLEGAVRRPDPEAFAAVRSISIDHAIMEHAMRIATVPVSIGWSDIGSWDALFDASPKGENGNSTVGPALVVDSSDCLIRSEGPTVAVVGASDLIIVCTNDCVLVAKRGESQKVKEAVEALKRDGRTDLL
jgi:mannose-1-phosphate guanylyltransferase/mannose-1-phosphate guanylyltransferase/mannose-6-phosphate isomerase